MASRSILVDLGPMALPVGESPAFQLLSNATSRHVDIEKLGNLLKGDRQQSDSTNAGEKNARTLPVPASLGAAANEIEAMSSMAASIEGVANAICHQLPKVAHINLREDFLAGTSLTAFEDRGCLYIELITANSSTRHWLEGKLPWLASYLGRRLQRPLHISVHDFSQNNLMTASVAWSLEAEK